MDENVRLTPPPATTPAAKAMLASQKPAAKPWERPPGATGVMPEIITACDLMKLEFPPTKWVVEGLIGPGLTVMAGKPKQGKSWMAMATGLAVACYQPLDGRAVMGGDVLYLALEDTKLRLQSRLRMLQNDLKPENGWVIPETLHLAVAWPRMGYTAQEMGLVFVREWLDKYAATARLVIIDTLVKFRKPQKGNGNSYAEDYDAASGLKDCVDMYGAAGEYIHHTRKLRSEDPFDEISGTQGIAGAADTLIVLENEKGRQKMYVKGRDIAESTIDISFRKNSGLWVLGPSKEGIDTEGRLAAATGEGRKTLVEACADWLLAFLKNEAYPAQEIQWAAEAAGHSFNSLKMAKVRLGRKGSGEIVNHNFSTTGAADWWSGIGPPIDWKVRKVPIEQPAGAKKEGSESTDSSPPIPE